MVLLSVFGTAVASTIDACRGGAEALERRDLPAAENLLKRCLQTQPGRLAPYLQLCAVYQLQGRDKDLHTLARKGLRLFPRERRFYLTVGIQAGRDQRFDQAIDVLGRGLGHWPDDSNLRSNLTQAYLSRGMAYLDKAEYARAEADLRRAVQLEPGNNEALLNLGRTLHNVNKSVEALEVFDRALQVDPHTPLVHFHRGLVLHALGEYDAAIAALSAEIERNSDYPPSFYFRGLCLISKADWEGARKDLERAVAKMPDHAQAAYALGRCLYRLGRIREAEAAFRRSAQLDPADPKSFYALGQLLREVGDGEASAAMFQQAAQLHTANRAATAGEIRFGSAPRKLR